LDDGGSQMQRQQWPISHKTRYLTAGEIVPLLIYEGVWRTMPNSCLPWCRCAH
jgi:hypothetical protein